MRALVAAVALLCASAPAALGDELIVLSAGAVKSVLPTLAEDFTRQSGTPVRLSFAAMGPLKAKLAAREPADVIVVTPAVLEELTRAGHIAGRQVPVARVGVGVAVKAGAPLPAIATVAQFRQAVLAAPVLAYGDPQLASSGAYFARLLEQQGLAAPVREKTRLLPDGYQVIAFIAQGKGTELGIAPITEIRASAAEGVQLAGPLPPDLQHYTAYVAVRLAAGDRAARADAFLSAISSPAARARFAVAGYETTP